MTQCWAGIVSFFSEFLTAFQNDTTTAGIVSFFCHLLRLHITRLHHKTAVSQRDFIFTTSLNYHY
jgi:hypothetical protein